MRNKQRTNQRPADGIGRRPVRRVVAGQPALPSAEQRRCEVPSIAGDHLDTDRFHLEIAVGDERIGERHRIADIPALTVSCVDRPRERAHRDGADVVEAEIVLAAEIAAGVEVARRAREPPDRPLRLGRCRGYSFLRMKHFR